MQALQGIQQGKINRDCRTLIEILAAYIIDGDTFAVNAARYRLWGIDAPEIHTPEGRDAQDVLRQLMNGGPWYCYPRAQDKYGRTVVQCFDPQGYDLACTLVNVGHAQDWPRFSGGYYRECAP